MLYRDEALLILALILDQIETSWPGEHPQNRLELLNYRGFDLPDQEEQAVHRLQEIGKKLVYEVYEFAVRPLE
jgi:hypothetical protein